MRFGESDVRGLLHGSATMPWYGGPDHSVTVWLGEPLIEWTINSLAEPAWSREAYALLKPFLQAVRRGYDFLSFGQLLHVEWSKNDPRSIRSSWMGAKGHPGNLQRLAEQCAPGVQALLLHASLLPEPAGGAVTAALFQLAAALRSVGADVDPDDLIGTMFKPLRELRPDDDAAKQAAP